MLPLQTQIFRIIHKSEVLRRQETAINVQHLHLLYSADGRQEDFVSIAKNLILLSILDFALTCSVCPFKSMKLGFSKRLPVVTSQEYFNQFAIYLTKCNFLKVNTFTSS